MFVAKIGSSPVLKTILAIGFHMGMLEIPGQLEHNCERHYMHPFLSLDCMGSTQLNSLIDLPCPFVCMVIHTRAHTVECLNIYLPKKSDPMCFHYSENMYLHLILSCKYQDQYPKRRSVCLYMFAILPSRKPCRQSKHCSF